MIGVCKERGIDVEFVSQAGVFVVRLRRRARAGVIAQDYRLNARQKKALDYAHQHKRITVAEHSALCDISKRQAERDVSSLVCLGLLLKTGGGRATAYLPVRPDERAD